jgi:hypothetical protein
MSINICFKVMKNYFLKKKVTSVIYLIGFVVFSLFSESDTQSWALNPCEEKKEKPDDKVQT